MPTFTADDVRHLARLARLELTEEEVATYTRQLGDILAFARQIEAVDTRSVHDVTEPSGAASMLRDDEVRASLPREAALGPSPGGDRATGLFKVPRVLNG